MGNGAIADRRVFQRTVRKHGGTHPPTSRFGVREGESTSRSPRHGLGGDGEATVGPFSDVRVPENEIPDGTGENKRYRLWKSTRASGSIGEKQV